MKISYNWLNDYFKIPIDVQGASDILTSIGLEVEGVTELFSEFDHLVIGKILDCSQHKNADRLKVTQVDVGEKVLQIVCGAKNVSKDQFVVVVLPGKTLITKKGESFKIKKTKIRGKVSEGMICGEDEIGLRHSRHDGIMEISGHPIPGSLAKDWLNIQKDYLIEIGLTPNRTDAFSHIGVSRDLCAYFVNQGHDVHMTLPDVSKYNNNTQLDIRVLVENNKCQKYLGVCLENVSVQESPDWLKHKLISIGLNPVNNIVDITNFVLYETGNPLHAFDYDKISASKIIVRKAKNGEKMETLDSKCLELNEDDLVISDNKQVLCLAGVIGGVNSGVTFKTKNIFLESAFFNSESVRKTSKRHALSSDSSYRFERGVDFNNCEYALQRAALLIQDVCNGKIGQKSQFVDVNLSCHKIDFSFDSCAKILGHVIPKNNIQKILNSLGFKITDCSDGSLQLTAPSYRADVYREIDVIEEILRIYGYDNLPSSDFIKFKPLLISGSPKHEIKNKISEFLSAGGFFEIKNNSLVKESSSQLLSSLPQKNIVKLMNPLSQELSIMRTDMFLGGLETIKYNLNRQMNNLKLFEFGKTYALDNANYVETEKLTIFACGVFKGGDWLQDAKKTDFFLMKGILHRLCDRFLPSSFSFLIKQGNACYSDSSLIYSFEDNDIVEIGQFSNKLLKTLSIKQSVYYMDININLFIKIMSIKNTKYQSVCKFPSVRRDLSLVADKSIPYADIESSVKKNSNQLLKEIILFDVYEGDKIQKHEKSYTISFLFSHDERTLKDSEVDRQMLKIYNYLVSEYNLSLRDGELV